MCCVRAPFPFSRPDDLEEIKLLKQKLAVAVKMEDYRMCAQLRDRESS